MLSEKLWSFVVESGGGVETGGQTPPGRGQI